MEEELQIHPSIRVEMSENKFAGSVCPSSSPEISSLVSVSHTRIVWSYEPETMRLLSCKNATEVTNEVFPLSGPKTTSPISASHTRVVWSSEPETMRLPSCENATEVTDKVCPSKIPIIVGQCSALPVFKCRVFGNCGRYCFETNEPFGANGNADR